MLNLTYEFQIQPNRQQEALMLSYLETCRQVYNYALRQRKDWIESRKCAVNACSIRHEYIMPPDAPKPSYASQCKSLAAAKKNIPDLAIPHTHVLQQALRTLEASFVAMWDRGHGFPRFKKPGRMRSFLFPQMGVNPVQGNRLKLPKIGVVKMRLSRPIPDGFELKQVRVVRRASGWYAMLILQLDVDVPERLPSGEPVGIDLGLMSFLATSTGELVNRPKFFVDLQSKLKSLQRKLKHKKKGSSNWRKVQLKIAQLGEHISNTRKDFHFKLAHHLCDHAGMIFAEDLNLKALSRGMLCKHTLDAGWGQFLNILKWVCWKRDVYFALVDANQTSQTCPQCQTVAGKKDLSQRVHECQHCGYKTDRDVAAAQIIVQRGILRVNNSSANMPCCVAVGQSVESFQRVKSLDSP
jgi:putative transposase